jgi:hypothetical protein
VLSLKSLDNQIRPVGAIEISFGLRYDHSDQWTQNRWLISVVGMARFDDYLLMFSACDICQETGNGRQNVLVPAPE